MAGVLPETLTTKTRALVARNKKGWGNGFCWGYLVPAGRTLGHWVGDIALVIWRVDHVGPPGVAEPDSVLVRGDLVIDEYCSRDGWWCYWSLRVYFGYDGDSGWPVGCNWCVGSGEECWIVAVVSECVGD